MTDQTGWALAFAVVLAACAAGETPADLDAKSHGHSTLAQPLSALDAGTTADETSDAAAGPSNDCCSTSGSGGCNDAVVSACVCEGDPFCCSTEYDGLCAKQAVSRCGQDCDERPPLSDCCSPSDVPGCSDAPVATCICEIDPFCCVFRFDQSCVNLGVSRCNPSCGDEEAVP